MPKLTINLSSLGGLALRSEGDLGSNLERPELRILGRENQYAAGIVNPMRMLGYLGPGNDTLSAITTDGAGIIGSSEVDVVNSKVYFLQRTDNLIKSDALVATTLASDHSIASSLGIDLQIYTVNGVRKLFRSYKDTSGEGRIGYSDFSTTYVDNWCGTGGAVANAFGLGSNEIRMYVADNGSMYVLDGSVVHRFDGTVAGGANGTAYPNVLTFPASFQLVDALDSKGYLWILLIQSSSNQFTSGIIAPTYAGVYIWDRKSSSSNSKDFIPIDGVALVKKIFSLDGIPHCITISTSGRTQIRRYNGSSFELVRELGNSAYPPFPDSMQSFQGGVVWLGVDGSMYFYGKPYAGAEDALFKFGDFTKTVSGWTQAFAGVIAIVCSDTNAELVYINYRDSGTDKAGIWYPFSTTVSVSAGNYRTLPYKLPKLCNVERATLYYPPPSSGGSAQLLDVNFYFNQSTSGCGTTTLTNIDGKRSYQDFPMGKNGKGANFIQMGLAWKAANLTSTITPSILEVEYEETGRKR